VGIKMGIVEALQSQKIERITVGNRFMYWHIHRDTMGKEYGVPMWRVRERGKTLAVLIVETEDEDEAVSVLLAGDAGRKEK
jgi:hypothetical protein